MKKNKTLIPSSIVYIILVIFIFVFGVFAQIIANVNKEKELDSIIRYKESSSLGYRVYYKENPFYTDEYISEGKTYVQEYVDKISADFSYDVNYSDELSTGSYEYYIKAKLVAYTPLNEDDDLWVKEYDLTDKESVHIVKDSSYSVRKSVDIDYNKFKNDFDNYTHMTNVNASAKLIVELVVNNKGEYPKLDNFQYVSSVGMEFPLGDTTFKIKKMATTNDDEHKIVKFSEDDHDKMYRDIISILLWILSGFMAFVLIIMLFINKKKMSYYERTLRKILVRYDDVIVNAHKLPLLTSLSVVEVTSFDELLDAQGEVHAPINFSENKKKRVAKFILVHDNLAWVYTLDGNKILEDTM